MKSLPDEHLVGERLAMITSYEGLSSRLAVLEEWQRAHPDTHRLEAENAVARREAVDLRLHEMNALRRQIDNERGTFITRELYDREHLRLVQDVASLRSSRDTSSGEKTILERLWPFILAALTFLAGHMVWK